MLSVNEVLQEIDEFLTPASSEPVNLVSALGRVIASDVISFHSLPPVDLCNIEGYAVHTNSLYQIPMPLSKIGKSKPSKVFVGEVEVGQTVEVSANCPVPNGTNAIIPKHLVEDDGMRVMVLDYINEGQNISAAGIDINKGDVILSRGSTIDTRHIALAATLQIPWLPVIRAPRIGMIVSAVDDMGSYEHMQMNATISVATALNTFIKSRGGVPTNLGLAVDLSASLEEIVSFKSSLENSLKSVDMLVCVGGVENTKENLIFTTLLQKKASLKKLPLAIGSGHSLIIGHKDNTPIIGLPGHHVASMLAASLYLLPAIDKMLGVHEKPNKKTYAILTRDLDECDKKTDYLYGKLIRKDNGEQVISPISAQDSLMLSVLTETECVIIVDKNLPLKSGTAVEIVMLNSGSIAM